MCPRKLGARCAIKIPSLPKPNLLFFFRQFFTSSLLTLYVVVFYIKIGHAAKHL